MSDPTRGKRLRAGQRWEPSVQDDVPSDFAAKYAANDPYLAIVVPQDDDATIPKYRYVSLSSFGAGMVPTFIAAGETFTVPANRQALYAMPIDNEGILIVDGFLINVD